MSSRLVPATLSLVDGVPFAGAYDDVYHSADGGMEQARHVFMGGNRLPQRWQGRAHFTIVETGFGLGLSFLATWDAWRKDPGRCERLHFVSIEKHPFRVEDLATLHAMWPELAELSAQLRAAWPPLVPGFHRLLLDGGKVMLTLVFGDIAACLPQIEAAADAFYLDGFSPSKNPDMWSPDILVRLNRLAAPGATVATYTVSSAVRKALAQAGFTCEKLPGFGRKREMLAARFEPRWQVLARPMPASREAVVIGAGVAGCAAAERLAARGWRVTLVERHAAPAQEASGNLAGIVMPLVSKDDNLPSRLSRAAYLFTQRIWRQLGGIGHGFAGEACGVLQLARDADNEAVQREAVEAGAYPPDYVRWVDAAEASRLLGTQAAYGGWLFPQGGWVTPASMCHALLAACGERLERRFGCEVAAIEREGEGWRVIDAAGNTVATAPVVVIASGAQAAALRQTRELPLQVIRGQVTHVPAAQVPPLPMVLCGEGYMTRPAQGICCVGATYEFDTDTALRQASQDENLARLAQLLPQEAIDAPELAGRVGFRCVPPDRLPLAGALPDPDLEITGSRLRDVPRLPGLYGLLGYASRGLIWAPFAAELLASQLEGEPLPLESELAVALDPARFALKAWRRGGKSRLQEMPAQE
jgi:tRNA 5-methylaminomethyl-2-thiouridine biosynthesis bifunctional protein